MEIKHLVKNPHPIYKRYANYWNFLLESYEGGLDYTNAMITKDGKNAGVLNTMWNYFVNGIQQNTQTTNGNLFMHPKERDQDYNRRVNMSYYYNFCAPIIDIYSDHLFKQAVIVEYAEIETTINNIENDIDRQGSSIQEFRKQMSDMAQLYGHCFVIVDSPDISDTEEIATLADQIAKRAFPYCSLYAPQNIINWALDEFGEPYWVLVREVRDCKEDPFDLTEDENVEVYYRLWTRTEWFLFDDDYKLENQGTHIVGKVPIVCVYDKKSKKTRNFLGISSIADISFICRDIYNASSELRQILRDQTFAFLAVQGTSDEYPATDLGTGKGLLYPEGRNAPVYVSPPTDNATVYFDHIDRQIGKIYSLAKIDAGGVGGNAKASPTVDGQSGVSKAWDFNQTNSSLSSKSANLEDAEIRIWQIFAAWEGKVWTGNVQYPNDFSISSIIDDLNEAEQEAKLNFGKTFSSEVLKAIARKKFPRKSDEDMLIIDKEIEAQAAKAEQPQTVSMAQRVSDLLNKNTATGGQKQGVSQ